MQQMAMDEGWLVIDDAIPNLLSVTSESDVVHK
jgi:hypothetical protein